MHNINILCIDGMFPNVRRRSKVLKMGFEKDDNCENIESIDFFDWRKFCKRDFFISSDPLVPDRFFDDAQNDAYCNREELYEKFEWLHE